MELTLSAFRFRDSNVSPLSNFIISVSASFKSDFLSSEADQSVAT